MVNLRGDMRLKSLSSVTAFSSVQWLFFLFANTIVVPISIGTAFNLPDDVIAMTIKSSFIFTGLASFIQGLMGHRYPVMEGHSGLLWGLMLNLAASASAMGLELSTIGGSIAVGIILSGIASVIIAAFNLIKYVQKIFTPMVMSIFLFLLSFQLIFTFFQGMIGFTDEGTIDIPVTLLSIGVVILVSILKIKGNEFLSNFSILIGIVIGWILFEVFFTNGSTGMASSHTTFTLFPLGAPNLEMGIIVVSFLAGLMNMSNVVVTVQAAADLYREEAKDGQYRMSFLMTGLFSILSAPLGLVAYVPYTSTIGFLQSTKILQKLPFYIGGVLLVILGLFPALGDFLATMPITVGNAVLLVAYIQLYGTAFSTLKGMQFNSNTIFRLAAPTLLGVSIMNIDPTVFNSLPIVIQPIITNGLIMGVLLSIILELVINWELLEGEATST
jgi:xanthine/uracil permease